MSVDHYENFPVASVLLPPRLRPAVVAIYHFARTADDLADEGDATKEQRLLALTEYEHELDRIENGSRAENRLFEELAEVIQQYRLPLQAFRDLLSAFKQDVAINRYADFETLLDYCARSANPVGTLMLHLYGAATPDNLDASAAICSALQLINFWQDVAIDWKKKRIYLPQEDLARFNIGEAQLAAANADAAWQTMMRFQTGRARSMLLRGSPLAKRLPGRMGWELRLVIQGGMRILEKIDMAGGNVFSERPRLHKNDWPLLFWRAIRM
ncbi:MAG: squalene synthase HpnC [Burkholderiales bacterium]|nr:squalene synthase HpnC [Burkholderiales bacterium]